MDELDSNHIEKRQETFVLLFVRHRDLLYDFIYSLVPKSCDAEDIFQKTSLVIWRKFAEYQPQSDFIAWAGKIAYFEVLHFRRKAKREKLIFNDQLLETLALEQLAQIDRGSERQMLLAECLEKLEPAQRTLLNLAYESDDSIKQVAASLSRSPQTIYNRLNHLRRLLFDCVNAALRQRSSTR